MGGKAENGGQGSQRHDEQLRLIFDKLDSLANDQLSVLREQVANCSKQLSMEQAERKSDSEMVWSSMQNLHGHLVQFISQPPPTAMTIMPESQRSLGGSRMPRSRSPSPRFPGQMPEHLLASRPRVPVRLPDALKQDPSRSSYSKSINEILEAQGDERNRLVACFNTDRAEVKALSDKIVSFAKEVQDIKNSVAAGNVSLVSIPKTEANLQQSEEPQDRSNASQEALAQEVNKLKDQVKQTPPLLLELTMQLHQLQQGLSGEKDERNIALENLSRKLDLVGTVYNLDSAQGKAENGGQGSQRHDEQLRLIFDKLDSLANDQLSVL